MSIQAKRNLIERTRQECASVETSWNNDRATPQGLTRTRLLITISGATAKTWQNDKS